MVRDLLEDENGMIWTGTSEGFCIFHPDSLIANSDNYHLFNNVMVNSVLMKSDVYSVTAKAECG